MKQKYQKSSTRQPDNNSLEPTLGFEKQRDVVWYLVLFCVSFLLYVHTFQHSWVLDDYGVLVDNRFVTAGIDGIPDILTHTYREGSGFFSDKIYRPLSQVMFAIEWEVFGDKPGLFHLINVLLYALLVVMIFAFLRKILKNISPWVPFLITLLFAVHPIHTEVVANVKSGDELLSALFVFITLHLSLQLVERNSIKGRLVILSALFGTYTLALFSKESAITLLALLPLTLFFFSSACRKDYFSVFGVMILSAALFLFVRQMVFDTAQQGDDFPVSIVDHYFYDEKFFTSWATAIFLLGKYLLMLFVPYPLVCDYSFNQLPLTSFTDIKTLLPLLLYIALLGYAILKIREKNLFSYAILFFIITMSIYSNLVIKIGSSFAERFLFVPSLGFCIAVVWGILKLCKIKPSRYNEKFVVSHKVLVSVVMIVCVFFSSLTIVRAAQWKDQYTLFSNDVKKSENSAHLRLYWGLALRDQALEYEEKNIAEKRWNVIESNNQQYLKYLRKSASQFLKAVDIYHDYATAYEQLGLVYMRIGECTQSSTAIDSAEMYLKRSLELLPTISSVNNNLAKILFSRQQYQEAKLHYLKALEWDPYFKDAYFNLGSVYGITGMYDSSLYYYQKCIEIDPNYYQSYAYMGLTYVNLGDFEKAIDMYDKAIKVDARNILAYTLKLRALFLQKRWNEAFALAEKALSIAPFDAELLLLHGKICVELNNLQDALLSFSRCIQYNPKVEAAYWEKAAIFERMQMQDSAAVYVQAARTIN